jgi:arsenate reductase
MTAPAPWRRFLAEFVGTALLVAAVVGSGIMATTLSPDDVGLHLLENSVAAALALGALILTFGPVSGAHFNPVVSSADWFLGRRARTGLTGVELAGYAVAQATGAVAGAILADLMFALPAIDFSAKDRSAGHLWLGEVVATAGLILVIFALARSGRAAVAPAAVGAYIGAAYWFTSSTSFANPAVTIGRACTDTFGGIAPGSVPGSSWRRSPVSPSVSCSSSRCIRGSGALPARSSSGTPPTLPTAAWSGTLSSTSTAARPAHPDVDDHIIGGTNRMSAKPTVLFVCVHNAGRSQMAAGWLRHLAGDTVEVRSAGSEPAEQINPVAVEAMREVGIDITANAPRKLDWATAESSDVLITMGCGDVCPFFPGKRYLDWTLDDPAGQGIDAVRPIRDDIKRRVEQLITELPVTIG